MSNRMWLQRVIFVMAVVNFLFTRSAPADCESNCMCSSGTPKVRVTIATTGDPICDCYPSGAPISLSANNTWRSVTVHSENAPSCGFANIGRITITSTGTVPANFEVLIGANPFPTQFANLDVAGVNWNGLTFSGSTGEDLRQVTRLDGRISGNLTGSVEAGTIGFLWIAGEVQTQISATNSTPPANPSQLFPSLRAG